MSRLSRETGLAYSTVFEATRNGKPIVEYATAKKLSDATGGAVSIAELCEPKAPVSPDPATNDAGDSTGAPEPTASTRAA